ncbi:MAG: twin-arginine translocase TatA/TatE family subunit [Candidatus Margulisbacteria bacterium]|nr:twin-arginine translocase TatA/TatE family subunit [Candidatus Margulisiibacteriota bacterium]
MGSTELIIVGLIVFVLFGAAAIPKFAKSIGEARKEFKKTMVDDAQATNESQKEPPTTPS